MLPTLHSTWRLQPVSIMNKAVFAHVGFSVLSYGILDCVKRLRHDILCFCSIAYLQCTSEAAVREMHTGQIFCYHGEIILKCFN